MKDKDYWLIQWRRDNEQRRVFTEVMGVANVVRQAVKYGEKRMSDALDSVEYDQDGSEELIEFALLFAQGHSIEEIADTMQLPESTVEAISDNKLLRW